jgi:ATP-dependent DNA helicase RecG
VTRQSMTNTSVRQRFGIEPANKATASRLIREALDAGMIRLVSEDVADKLRAYVPFWA